MATNSISPSEPSTILLSPIDNVMPRTYISKLLFFPKTESDPADVVQAFRAGLRRLLTSAPQLGGTIQRVRNGHQEGALCVASPWHQADDIFHMRDLRHLGGGLDYAYLRDKHFPALQVAKEYLLPDMVKANLLEKPVLLIQVSLITGGFIVTLSVHHAFTDGNGTYTIARGYAASCRGEDASHMFSGEILDRQRLMYGWGAPNPNLEGVEFSLLPSAIQPSPVATSFSFVRSMWGRSVDGLTGYLPRKLVTWLGYITRHVTCAKANVHAEYFFFSRASLVELKQLATNSRSEKHPLEWISTNDALCSLLRCCIASARRTKPEQSDISTVTKKSVTDKGTDTSTVVRETDTNTSEGRDDPESALCVVMNVRHLMQPPIPAGSISNVLFLPWLYVPGSTLRSTESNVAEFAFQIRRQLRHIDENAIRHVLASLASVPDIGRVAMRGRRSTSVNDILVITSWRGQDFYDLDWGKAIGRVERVRYCRLASTNLCIIMPEIKGNVLTEDQKGLEVYVALSEEELSRLKKDSLFTRFAKSRCAD